MKKYIYACLFLKFSKGTQHVKFVLFLCLLFNFMSCMNTSKTPKMSLKEIAKELMVHAESAALITVDSEGVTHVRAMDPFLPEDNFTVWMGTNPKSLKVSQIQKNKLVSLYYFDKESAGYIAFQGVATIVNTKDKKEQYWKKEWKNFYKNTTTDYVLIKFVPNKATIISEKHQVLGDSITWAVPKLTL
jgi:general stress protein 26